MHRICSLVSTLAKIDVLIGEWWSRLKNLWTHRSKWLTHVIVRFVFTNWFVSHMAMQIASTHNVHWPEWTMISTPQNMIFMKSVSSKLCVSLPTHDCEPPMPFTFVCVTYLHHCSTTGHVFPLAEHKRSCTMSEYQTQSTMASSRVVCTWVLRAIKNKTQWPRHGLISTPSLTQMCRVHVCFRGITRISIMTCDITEMSVACEWNGGCKMARLTVNGLFLIASLQSGNSTLIATIAYLKRMRYNVDTVHLVWCNFTVYSIV